jgi:hypothetical protein
MWPRSRSLPFRLSVRVLPGGLQPHMQRGEQATTEAVQVMVLKCFTFL